MRTALLLFVLFTFSSGGLLAQAHGSFSYQAKTISLTGYRTRMSGDKWVVIADAKSGGKLYSLTITLRPDMQKAGSVKTDATHSVTLTISNEDYSNAQNFCFDGGGALQITPQSGSLMVSGTDLPPGDCFGKSKTGDKVTFTMKP